jgi:4-carboxymuconolactone decarboxylase
MRIKAEIIKRKNMAKGKVTSDTQKVRVPLLEPGQLTEAQKRLYDSVLEGRRDITGVIDSKGHLRGPFNALLYSPEVGCVVQALGTGVRHHSSLSRRAQELAILMVASKENSEFEWDSHVRFAESFGWTSEQALAIREGKDPGITDPIEKAVWQTTAVLLATRDLKNSEYDEAIRQLGYAGLVDLTILIGYYQLLALQLRIFRITSAQT